LNQEIGDFRLFYDIPSTEVDWFHFLLNKTAATMHGLVRYFDPGMVIIPWLWSDDESALEECWAAAAACGGVFFTDVYGYVIYHNAATIAKNANTPVEALSRTAGSFGAGSITLNQDELYSDVTVEVSTRSIAEEEIIWSPEEYENLAVPANGTLTVLATYDDPIYLITKFEWESANSAGYNMDSYTSVVRKDYAQKSELIFTNTHPTDTSYIKYFRIFGYPVSGNTTFEYTASSVRSFWADRGRRNRSIRQNPYIQTPVQARFLADLVLAESEKPRPILQLSSIPGNPFRFIGDVVSVTDASMFTGTIIGQIESMSWQIGITYTQDLTIRGYGGVYGSNYFKLNDSASLLGGARIIFY
jgi:hypothetical protein